VLQAFLHATAHPFQSFVFVSETSCSSPLVIVASTRCLEGNGMGGLIDASVWGALWAMVAVVAGSGLAAAAATLWRGRRETTAYESAGGYNALAPTLERRSAF
jgi:hypothetical protein